ncbi:MAG: DUF1499 domain-containing protein [Deltaproteobacteria bacterium]|nr:DUF1499 domain-containing protein [Deltaproteobacteria bacterium]
MRRRSRLCYAGFLAALVLLSLAALSGPGSRWGLWHFRTGFTIMRFCAYGAFVSFALSFAGVIVCVIRRKSTKGVVPGLAGLVISLAAVVIPLMWSLEANRVPRIHDITTDTANPPVFSALPALRPTPAEYAGAEVAGIQRARYPEIKPLELNIAPEAAFDAALKAARGLGWEIIDADRPSLHIEAVDTTLWYGFKDDIAVRITAGDVGSRIDVRSVSRVGISDIGTNARRIRRYFDAVRKASVG